MTESASESFWKVPDPRGLLGQTRAVALMRSDDRASYKHFALIEFHWGWAHKDYDWTSLASVRRMHSELGLRDPLNGRPMSMPHINSGNRDLCDWGWLFEIEKGSGRTASRFLPNFTLFEIADQGSFRQFLNGDLTFSVNPVGERKGFEISVHPVGNSRVTYEVNANAFSVHPLGNKDLLTWTGLQDGPTESRNDPAPPTAPLPDGLTATGAGSAGGGFEEVWRAYGHRQKKADARAAYIKAAPSADLHIRMVDAARAWFSAWAAQGKADAPRFTLAKWIEREEYECDPPTSYKAKERKTAKPVAEADEEKENKPNKLDFSAHPDRPSTGTIERVETSVADEDGARLLQITYRTRDDEAVEQLIVYESSDQREQERGQAELESLLAATGVASIWDDPSCLVGRPVDLMLSFDGKFVSCSEPWVPAPKTVRNAPRFKDVVRNTPWGGWAKKLGTSTDEDEAA